MSDPGGDPLWRIVADARLTRRKYYHCVQTPDRTTVFKTRLMSEAVEFLRAAEVTHAELIASEDYDRQGNRRAILSLE